MKFNLFDTVKLKEPIPLTEGGTAAIDTTGTIVEIFNNGEAYLVELFGDWVKYDEQDNLISADRDDPNAFIETIGVETVYPHQLSFIKPAEETIGIRGQLFAVLETLPEDKLAQIKDFAEFLKSKSAIA